MAPSKIIKVICWLAKGPLKPSLSSATRKIERINMHVVARARAEDSGKEVSSHVLAVRDAVDLGMLTC